ncbi:MAG: hypothetical protein M1814_004779 [Vezdaea aestivalis]|nr:MAG: hypothetical protein M1814_004779 [Vezdaea aestivalis]
MIIILARTPDDSASIALSPYASRLTNSFFTIKNLKVTNSSTSPATSIDFEVENNHRHLMPDDVGGSSLLGMVRCQARLPMGLNNTPAICQPEIAPGDFFTFHVNTTVTEDFPLSPLSFRLVVDHFIRFGPSMSIKADFKGVLTVDRPFLKVCQPRETGQSCESRMRAKSLSIPVVMIDVVTEGNSQSTTTTTPTKMMTITTPLMSMSTPSAAV